MYFPTITELLENLIQIGRGLERSCDVFHFNPKIFIWPLSKTRPTRAEYS